MNFHNLFVILCLFSINGNFAFSENKNNQRKRNLTREKLQRMKRNVIISSRESADDLPVFVEGGKSIENEHFKKTSSDYKPSSELKEDHEKFVPAGFSMKVHKENDKKTIVSFKYEEPNSPYDQYKFRIRYHGHSQYSSHIEKIEISKDGINAIILHEFIEDEYIVCVAFYANDKIVPPLSTADMCVDVLFGEEPSHGEEHSVTGLLSPLLLAVAALILIVIVFVDYFQKRYKEYAKNKSEKVNLEKRKSSVHSTVNMPTTLNKNDLSQIFNQVERRGSVWGERVKGRLVKVKESNPAEVGNYNGAYSSTDEDDNIDNKTSLETLRHLLNSKPWASNSKENIETIEEEETREGEPSFYLQK